MWNKVIELFTEVFEDDTQGDVLGLDNSLPECDLFGEQAELRQGICLQCEALRVVNND